MDTIREQMKRNENTVFLANLIELRIHSISSLYLDTLEKLGDLETLDRKEYDNLIQLVKSELKTMMLQTKQLEASKTDLSSEVFRTTRKVIKE